MALRHKDRNIDMNRAHTAAGLGMLHISETPARTANRGSRCPEDDAECYSMVVYGTLQFKEQEMDA